MKPLVETRNDGWPLCPRCGEDELYSALHWDGLTDWPPMQAWIDAGLTCYKCSWSNIDPITLAVTPLHNGGSDARKVHG